MLCKVDFDLDDRASCLDCACFVALGTLLRSPERAEQALATVSSIAQVLRDTMHQSDAELREAMIKIVEPIAPVTSTERIASASVNFADALETIYALALRAGETRESIRESLQHTLDLAIGYVAPKEEQRRASN